MAHGLRSKSLQFPEFDGDSFVNHFRFAEKRQLDFTDFPIMT